MPIRVQPPSDLLINKESEVYKMLQEKQQLNEPLKSSTSCLILQDVLQYEIKGDLHNPQDSEMLKLPTLSGCISWMLRRCLCVTDAALAMQAYLIKSTVKSMSRRVRCAHRVPQ
ncbi:PDZ and LIM domain protein 1, partial [Plecturocebus cupreus]